MVYPVWDFLGFLDFGVISFPILGKFSTIISSSIFSWSFFLSSSGTHIIQMLGHLTLSWRSLRLSSLLLFIFSSLFHLFLPFYLLPHLSYLLPPLFYCWFPPECFWSHLLLLQRRQWHPTPVLLPGKSHGQRSLEGCSPWGR